jgi:hypothetical protein
MTTAHQVLKAARALIADPKHWTQGELARDADGNPEDEYQPEAVCFCSVGALMRAARVVGDDLNEARFGAFTQVGNITLDLRGLTIVEFNDAEDTTHADVLAVFDKAIEATKGNP